MRNVSPKTLANLLVEPKTLSQIGRVIQTTATTALVRTLELPEDYALFEQKNQMGEMAFRAVY